ncbi:MAG: hypothetical protein GYA17_04150 [Chloroflexi bacterium]|jgi:hypothetical protein|nr:hypothetical protein [Anaerolineaceae bacterium]NMB87528.1 hypothetical protein [Chloroflexota bacterium]
MAQPEIQQSQLSPIDAGIILLTIATGLIHLSLNFAMGRFDAIFTLNGLGYLGLLAGLYLPLPVAQDNRRLVRFALLGFALLTIVLWIFLGQPYTTLGFITKAIEVVLVILLFLKRP